MIPPSTLGTHLTDQSISTIHHALRAPRRRLTVVILTQRALIHDESEDDEQGSSTFESSEFSIHVRDLAREIVANEQDIPLQNATGEQYHAVYTALTQTHLPYLNEVKAINYLPNRKIVRPGQNLTALAIVASITSPVAQLIFYASEASLYDRSERPEDSLGDL